MAKRWLATAVSFLLVFFSPGLGCYQALAEVAVGVTAPTGAALLPVIVPVRVGQPGTLLELSGSGASLDSSLGLDGARLNVLGGPQVQPWSGSVSEALPGGSVRQAEEAGILAQPQIGTEDSVAVVEDRYRAGQEIVDIQQTLEPDLEQAQSALAASEADRKVASRIIAALTGAVEISEVADAGLLGGIAVEAKGNLPPRLPPVVRVSVSVSIYTYNRGDEGKKPGEVIARVVKALKVYGFQRARTQTIQTGPNSYAVLGLIPIHQIERAKKAGIRGLQDISKVVAQAQGGRKHLHPDYGRFDFGEFLGMGISFGGKPAGDSIRKAVEAQIAEEGISPTVQPPSSPKKPSGDNWIVQYLRASASAVVSMVIGGLGFTAVAYRWAPQLVSLFSRTLLSDVDNEWKPATKVAIFLPGYPLGIPLVLALAPVASLLYGLGRGFYEGQRYGFQEAVSTIGRQVRDLHRSAKEARIDGLKELAEKKESAGKRFAAFLILGTLGAVAFASSSFFGPVLGWLLLGSAAVQGLAALASWQTYKPGSQERGGTEVRMADIAGLRPPSWREQQILDGLIRRLQGDRLGDFLVRNAYVRHRVRFLVDPSYNPAYDTLVDYDRSLPTIVVSREALYRPEEYVASRIGGELIHFNYADDSSTWRDEGFPKSVELLYMSRSTMVRLFKNLTGSDSRWWAHGRDKVTGDNKYYIRSHHDSWVSDKGTSPERIRGGGYFEFLRGEPGLPRQFSRTLRERYNEEPGISWEKYRSSEGEFQRYVDSE